jgi:hypothetical protein
VKFIMYLHLSFSGSGGSSVSYSDNLDFRLRLVAVLTSVIRLRR